MENELKNKGPVKVLDYEIENVQDALNLIMNVIRIIHEQVLSSDEKANEIGISNIASMFEFFISKGWISAITDEQTIDKTLEAGAGYKSEPTE